MVCFLESCDFDMERLRVGAAAPVSYFLLSAAALAFVACCDWISALFCLLMTSFLVCFCDAFF